VRDRARYDRFARRRIADIAARDQKPVGFAQLAVARAADRNHAMAAGEQCLDHDAAKPRRSAGNDDDSLHGPIIRVMREAFLERAQ
jgi:hypothetical protein